MHIRSKQVHNILLLVLATIVTCYMLSYMVAEPAHSLTTIGGDGMKNYYTYLYHSINGSGLHFEGMNYPYGEHIVYTDAQPLLTLVFSSLNTIVPLSYEQLIGALHLLLAISFFLAIVYNYKILLHFKVRGAVAVLSSVFIAAMSPQVFKMFGHFALGYQCFAPMLFYFSIKYNSSKRIKYLVGVFLLGIASSLLHPYYVALLFIWLLLYIVGYLLITKGDRKYKMFHIIPVAVVAIGVFGFVKALMTFSDPIKDRTEYPYGTLSACTTGKDIFTSDYSPIWQFFHSKNIIKHVGQGEGLAYLGLVGTAILIVVVVTMLVRLIKKKKVFADTLDGQFSPVWLFVALGCFLLAQGVPFVWGMEWLLDYVSTFRQFRSLGRFAFLFYNVIAIYGVVLLYNYFKGLIAKGKSTVAYLLMILCFSVWAIEVNGYIISSRKMLVNAPKNYQFLFAEHDWKRFLKEQWFEPDDFQGIILLPYVHVGSEKLWVNGHNNWVSTLGFNASLQLKLPIVNVNMSRTSWSQTYEQVRTVAGPYADKPLFNTQSDKPFLLIHWYERDLPIGSKYLIESGEHIGRMQQCDAYALYPKKILEQDSSHLEEVKDIARVVNRDTVLNAEKGEVIADHFQNGGNTYSFFGDGALNISYNEVVALNSYSFLNPLQNDETYEISIWAKVNNKDYRTPSLSVSVLDSNNQELANVLVAGKESVDNRGEWIRLSKEVLFPKHSSKISINIENSTAPTYTSIDELLIRPTSAKVIFKSGDSMLVNNHYIELH